MRLKLLLLSLFLISCNNNSVESPDCAGVSGGNAVEDCGGVCGGDALIDECGVCGGPGMYECENGTLVCDISECPEL